MSPASALATPRPICRPERHELFVQHQRLIEDVVAWVCRQRRLAPPEAEDFASSVRLRLLEDGCAAIRQFKGESSLRTYLSKVVDRMLLDGRIREWGKWRTSEHARRLGAHAVRLEKLTSRDGYSFEEAVEVLRTGNESAASRKELWFLYSQLPARVPRRAVAERELMERASAGASPEEVLLRKAGARPITLLREAVRRLPSEDRCLLAQRYACGRRVTDVAAALGTERAGLYRRYDAILRRLRRILEEQGLEAADVLASLRTLDVSPRASVLTFRR